VVAGSDLLTVLPERFVQATGATRELVIRELPMALVPVYVEMLWHLRNDTASEHRWLRSQMKAAAGAVSA
jgi:DNA-binding transcriptional LysR family regulator